ncbi:MAG: holo-ACP synthase [Gemmatimonadaceae bacterium]
MRIIGHGIDVVSVAAIKSFLESRETRWEEKVYSVAERSNADAPPIHSRYYAGRFAGKEAVAKAMGTGFAGDVTWRGIEILRRENGQPYVELKGEVLEFANTCGITQWLISITHCGDTTTASVIALGD